MLALRLIWTADNIIPTDYKNRRLSKKKVLKIVFYYSKYYPQMSANNLWGTSETRARRRPRRPGKPVIRKGQTLVD